ncbi:MAG: DUF3768 domain-containing protein [Alphaproteobacteria bacterium]|nr:DUF3768 domain-containing protein [Alphaproteobacteria bacterium]
MVIQTAALTANVKNNAVGSTTRVRELNDTFRRDIFNINLGTLFFTPGVAALKDGDRFALITEVQCFEDFNENNDPWQEHDFGRIDFQGERYFFKIDYYDKAMQFHSPDKSDHTLTNRVLTIMHASEY